jgi:hypothetical protein
MIRPSQWIAELGIAEPGIADMGSAVLWIAVSGNNALLLRDE